MTLQDGVHFLEGVFIVAIACVALYIGRYLYQDEQAKIAAVSCRCAKLAPRVPLTTACGLCFHRYARKRREKGS